MQRCKSNVAASDETKRANGLSLFRLRGALMKDGLYRVTTRSLCAGFVVKNGLIVAVAHILQKHLAYWLTVAKWIGP